MPHAMKICERKVLFKYALVGFHILWLPDLDSIQEQISFP